jgi:hypothetical protein
MSVYVIYPNKQDRKTSLKRIEEALNRICEGEIDGSPRTPEEALKFLREKTEEARVAFYGREKKWIPHSTTFFFQSRYLRTNAAPEDLPSQLEAAITILSSYPTAPSQIKIRADVKAFAPALKAIDKALNSISMVDLTKRVKLYRDAVSAWPKEDWRYIPNPAKWFAESRFLQDEQLWQKKLLGNWQAEREQIARLVGKNS